MRIEKYISDLMFRYQCVVVPGFGAFLTQNQPAYYDEKADAFFPPFRRLSFNVNIIYNDGLLAHHIASDMKISYEQALDLIYQQTSKWMEDLKTLGHLNLDQIGEIQLLEDNVLMFSPAGDSSFKKTSFGLSAVTAFRIDRSLPVVSNKKTVKLKPKYNLLPYVASVAILTGVGYFLFQNGYDSYKNYQDLEIQKKVQVQLENQIQQATFFIEPTAKVVNLPVVEKQDKTPLATPYYIIACAFRNQDAANSQAEKLKESGHDHALVLPRSKYGMYPVAYGGFTDKESAQSELRKIHKKSNKDAWILVQ
ncbi:HU domain-containing protein [Myroides sp. LJL119]